MANLLQSSQNKETTAPSYYTNYLSNLATQGQAAAGQADYVGAQPLQTKAFEAVCQNFGAQQPGIATGKSYIGQAAGQDVTGAAAPFLQAGTNASPLCAARPLICQTANLNLSCLASDYMSPYIQTAVQGMSDIAQRNIRNNLSPAATAAAVGSGQFGSQRGAQVLGQVNAQAQQDLNTQIANMQNQGYAQALQAATAKQGALGQLANTTANAQQAQNAANLTAGSTAAQAAANEGQLLNTAGTNIGNLAQTGAGMNLACINALSTLGGQQQTIGQNAENFPLTKLASLGSLLQGYSIPVGTKTTLCMSPLSSIAAAGAGGLGLYEKIPGFKGIVDKGFDSLGNLFGSGANANAGAGNSGYHDPVYDESGGQGTATDGSGFDESGFEDLDFGNSDFGPGFDDSSVDPGYFDCCYGGSAFAARGGLIKSRARGYTGCASTAYRGALPQKKG
jgi:hypothetical protein